MDRALFDAVQQKLTDQWPGSVTDAEQIALRERCSVRHVNMTISLAFLAPKLVRAAVEGRLPRGINIARLRDAPAEWSRQFEALGLNPQNSTRFRKAPPLPTPVACPRFPLSCEQHKKTGIAARVSHMLYPPYSALSPLHAITKGHIKR
jgi:hypothetical protein